MNTIINWIIDQKEWIFSGIGVFIIGLFIRRIRKNSINMNQKVTGNSKGIQAGKDIYISQKK